jgi:hypothetical protein
MPLRGKGIIRIHHTILSTNLSKTKKKRKEKEAKRSTTSHVGEILLLPLCMIQNMGRERKNRKYSFLKLNLVDDLCYKCSQLTQRWCGGAAAGGAGGLH